MNLLITSFKKHDIRYGTIGGFSMFLMGIPRTTVDLDFMIHHEDLGKLHRIMDVSGYECIYQSENVTQFVGKTEALGGIDVLHAFRKYALIMLENAMDMKFGDLDIKVLRPVDIIGLKVQAIANDKNRQNREIADIEAILEKYRDSIDWSLMKEYFNLFDLAEDYETLKKKYG